MFQSPKVRSIALKRQRAIGRVASSVSALFSWCLISPSVAAAVQPRPKRVGHVRTLTGAEMTRIVGAQISGGGGQNETGGGDGGGTNPWEGGRGGGTGGTGGTGASGGGPTLGGGGSTGGGITNTINGNKLTNLPIVSWKARGGYPVELLLHHNSEGGHNGKFGPKWTCSFDDWLLVDATTGNVTVHSGDDLSHVYAANLDGTFTAPAGVYNALTFDSTANAYTVVIKAQTAYKFTNPNGTGWPCTSVKDRSSDMVT